MEGGGRAGGAAARALRALRGRGREGAAAAAATTTRVRGSGERRRRAMTVNRHGRAAAVPPSSPRGGRARAPWRGVRVLRERGGVGAGRAATAAAARPPPPPSAGVVRRASAAAAKLPPGRCLPAYLPPFLERVAESQSRPSYRPSPVVAQVAWMNHSRPRSEWRPSLSVISAGVMARGKSCLLANTSSVASRSSSSESSLSSSALASSTRSRSFESTTKISPCVFW
mmetsp:Transcript_11643/g.40779  ORF Transcript_11643/g.40779 Transcript_11643/m.40779 type:complete len:227 (+) Transcript_11643:1062-1742(+)